MSSNKGNSSKTKLSEQEIEKLIISTMQKRKETKVVVSRFLQHSIAPDINNFNDWLPILPNINQNVTQQGRIGSEIYLKKLTIRTIISCDNFGASENNTSSNWLIRDMFYRWRGESASESEANGGVSFPFDEILEGPQAYQGALGSVTIQNYMRPLNSDSLVIRSDKKFKLTGGVNQSNWASGAPEPNAVKMYEKTFTFGKGMKLIYSKDADVLPNNFPFLRSIVASSPNGTITPVGEVVAQY